MRVVFENVHAGGIPLLVARGDAAPLGTVLWYHGFGVDKETHRPELTRFAKAGFIAVGVDVVGHGEREAADLEQRKAGTQAEALSSVIEFASATARELPTLVDYLVASKLAAADNIALAGISMGAFVVYRALLEDVQLACAVAIIGSPEWPADDSPHRHIDKLCRVPLLSITGECDVNVPAAPARRLHRSLARCDTQQHRYLEIPGAEHLMNATDWETTMTQTIAWLKQHRGRNV